MSPSKNIVALPTPRLVAVVREVNDPEERVLRLEVVRVAAWQ